MVRIAGWLVVLIALSMAGAATAEIYRWVDEQGKRHFAQDMHGVPPKHRRQAEENAKNAPKKPNPIQVYKAPVVERHHWAVVEGPNYRKGGVIKIKLQPSARKNSYYLDARLNGKVTARFLLDTGASGVSITSAVAERLGLSPDGNTKWANFRTANGTIKKALVTLDSVDVNGAYVANVEGSISTSMSVGLLGASFLNNFEHSIDPIEHVLTLTPRNRNK